VFAVVEQDGGHRGDSALESLDLLGRAIFILLSLNYQDWAADRIQEWFDIPVAKNGIEPDIVPGPEERIDIRVIPAQTLGQVRFKVLRARSRDARYCDVLDEHVRSFQNEISFGTGLLERRVGIGHFLGGGAAIDAAKLAHAWLVGV